MSDDDYSAYLKRQSYDDLLVISYALDKDAHPNRYAMVLAEIGTRDNRGEKPEGVTDEKQNDRPGPLILFPEVIGISILALLLPVPLGHMLISGQMLMGVAGFAFWLAALFFAARFIRRRQYPLVWLPMLVLIGLFFVVKKLSG